MKRMVLGFFLVLLTTAGHSADGHPLFRQPDAESKFRDAQLHVKGLMEAGKYKEASEYMAVYQRLACEAAEQRAGRSIEEGAANCARNNQAGMSASSVPERQQEQFASGPSPTNTLAPGVTMVERALPGSSTLLDSSPPSLFLFDSRTDSQRSGSQGGSKTADPWTGAR